MAGNKSKLTALVVSTAIALAALFTGFTTAFAGLAGWIETFPDVCHADQTTPVSATYKKYAVTPDGTAYFAYQIGTTVYLRRFDGSTWTYIGGSAGFTFENQICITVFAVSPDGTPYLAIHERTVTNTITVKLYKYCDGALVKLVDALQHSAEEIEFSSDGRPYVRTNIGVCYIDQTNAVRFVAAREVADGISFKDLAIAPDDVPYIVTAHYTYGVYEYRVRKLVSGSWTDVGVAYNSGSREYPTLNLQIATDGTVYLCRANDTNKTNGYIIKNNGTTWIQQINVPYSVAKQSVNFFRLGSDGCFYLNVITYNDIAVIKNKGALWILGDTVEPVDNFALTDFLLTTGNTAYLASYADVSSLASFVFDTQPPVLSNLKFSIYASPQDETVLLGQKMFVTGKLATAEPATVKFVVFDAQNRVVAQIVQTDQISTNSLYFGWTGLVTEGNEAGLPAGFYVPANEAGVPYTVKIYAENCGGGTWSESFPLLVIAARPEITSHYVVETFGLRTYMQTLANVHANSHVAASAQGRLYDAQGRLAATIAGTRLSIGSPDRSFTIIWDGKATADNAMGLNAGDYVPATEDGTLYSLYIGVSNEFGETVTGPFEFSVILNIPKISTIELLPDADFHLGVGDDLYLRAHTDTLVYSTMELSVRDAQNRKVAVVVTNSVYNQTTSYRWDGKATAGNEAGLTPGDYAPASPTGTDYTLQLRVFNVFGEDQSETYPIKVYCDPPEVANEAVPQEISFNGTNRLDLCTVSSTVPVLITQTVRDTLGRVVSSVSRVAEPSQTIPLFWDGKATVDNEAGLPQGCVPRGHYSICASVINCAGQADTQTHAFYADVSNVLLKSVTVHNGEMPYAITPAITAGVFNYSVIIPHTVSQVAIAALPEDANAEILYSAVVNAAYGANPVTITVTAQDGLSVGTYTLTILRQFPDDNRLSNIAVSAGALTPAFASDTLAYELILPSTATSVTITPGLSDPLATMTIDSVHVASALVTLGTGNVRQVSIAVAAQNGSIRTYKLYITRNAVNYAKLLGITTNAGTLSPAFSPTVYSYTLSLNEATEGVIVNAIKSSPKTEIYMSGTTFSLLNGATQPMQILSTYAGTTKTYNITIRRAKSTDATLKLISFGAFFLTPPVFNPQTTTYDVPVSEVYPEFTVHPIANSPLSVIYIDGVRTSEKELNIDYGGSKTCTIKVVAQSGASKTYTLNFRLEKSTKPWIIALSDRPVDGLSMEYRYYNYEYTIDLPEKANGLWFKPKGYNKFVAFRFDGVAAQSRFVPVAYGTTRTVTITGVAQAGNTKDYLIHLRRPAHLAGFDATPKASAYAGFSPGGTNAMTFSYALEGSAIIQLDVLVGSQWKTLLTREETAGAKTFVWDGTVDGEVLPVGRYKARLTAQYEGLVSSPCLLKFDILSPPVVTATVTSPYLNVGSGKYKAISLSWNVASNITVEVYDNAGKPVALLWKAVNVRPGRKTLYWSGRSASGDYAAPGSYTVVVTIGGAAPVVLPLRLLP